MIALTMYALLGAAFVALVAVLQASAKWWAGPGAALLLFLVGLGGVMLFPPTGSPSPQAGLAFVAWLCAVLVLIGSLTGLALRPFLNERKLASRVFFGAFGLSWVAMIGAALWFEG